jgi:hypothetical protein
VNLCGTVQCSMLLVAHAFVICDTRMSAKMDESGDTLRGTMSSGCDSTRNTHNTRNMVCGPPASGEAKRDHDGDMLMTSSSKANISPRCADVACTLPSSITVRVMGGAPGVSRIISLASQDTLTVPHLRNLIAAAEKITCAPEHKGLDQADSHTIGGLGKHDSSESSKNGTVVPKCACSAATNIRCDRISSYSYATRYLWDYYLCSMRVCFAD